MDKHSGSSFDSFLTEEGIKDEVDAVASRRVRNFRELEEKMGPDRIAESDKRVRELLGNLDSTKFCSDFPGAPYCCESCHMDYEIYGYPLLSSEEVEVCCTVANWLNEQKHKENK